MSPARLRPTLRLALGELVREPVQPIVEPRALGGTRRLHVPLQNRGRRGGGRRPGGERAPGRTPRGVPEVPPEVPAHSRSCCAAPAGPACQSARSRPWRWACPACWQTPAARRPAARPPAAAGRWGRLSQARGQEGSGSSAPPSPCAPIAARWARGPPSFQPCVPAPCGLHGIPAAWKTPGFLQHWGHRCPHSGGLPSPAPTSCPHRMVPGDRGHCSAPK